MSARPPTFSSRVDREIAARIRRACQEALDQGQPSSTPRLLVAVSGGPDSTAVLLALASALEHDRWQLAAAHIDHGIATRDVRDQFRDAAGQAAALVGVPLHLAGVDAPAAAAASRDGLEAAARRLRYTALLQQAAEAFPAGPAHAIVTGHTMDDQAESVLLHLTRGAAADGLAGMPLAGPLPLPGGATLPLLRPALGLRRAQLARLGLAAGLRPVHDPANDDRRYTRVRIRREVLPALAAINPAIVQRLAALAEAVRVDRAYLDTRTDAAQAALAGRADPSAGGVVLSRRALQRQPRALRARLLRRHVIALGGEAPDWNRTTALLRLVARGGHRVQCAGGVLAEAAGDRICLRGDGTPRQ